jgi:hypothetical protein
MKWIKHGKIFDPTQHNLLSNCVGFSQSPQTLVFDDFVRIYFATRSVDKNKKFLSHIAFVDMTLDFKKIIRISDNVVIPLGELGAFDEHGIFPINVLRHGEKIIAYTTGWNRRVSVSVDTAIGLAVSNDNGLTFQKQSMGPVLAASIHEPCLVGDGFVKVINGTFHMWYIFGTGWKKYTPESEPDRTYKIGHAVSSDGVDWVKEEAKQIIPDRLGVDESQALPTVIEIKGRYHMFFCYRESFDFRRSSGRGYQVGHAFSDNLLDWVRDDANPILEAKYGDWDGEMQCYPHVFSCNEKVYLLYNGNEFGRYGFGLAELEYE